jgi:hypothetical protein
MQQPSRFYIGAHANGVVNEVAFEFETAAGTDLVVLPLPRYLDVQAQDLVTAITAHGGAYWLQSYASLCGLQFDTEWTLEALCDVIAELDHQYDHEPPLPGLSTDWERF